MSTLEINPKVVYAESPDKSYSLKQEMTMPASPPIRNGVQTIWAASRKICRVASKFNTVSKLSLINPNLAAAVAAIVAACDAISSLDDYPFEIDSSAPEVGPGKRAGEDTEVGS